MAFSTRPCFVATSPARYKQYELTQLKGLWRPELSKMCLALSTWALASSSRCILVLREANAKWPLVRTRVSTNGEEAEVREGG